MIVVHLKPEGSVGVPNGAAVAASTFPTATGTVVASFRAAEVAGYTVESHAEPWTVPA